jgi:hypothetical protein
MNRAAATPTGALEPKTRADRRPQLAPACLERAFGGCQRRAGGHPRYRAGHPPGHLISAVCRWRVGSGQWSSGAHGSPGAFVSIVPVNQSEDFELGICSLLFKQQPCRGQPAAGIGPHRAGEHRALRESTHQITPFCPHGVPSGLFFIAFNQLTESGFRDRNSARRRSMLERRWSSLPAFLTLTLNGPGVSTSAPARRNGRPADAFFVL